MRHHFIERAPMRILAAIIGLSIPSSILAEDVQLQSYDRSMTMTGELLGYNTTGFEIRTSLGVLLVAKSLVTCDGVSCPSAQRVQRDLKASGFVAPDRGTASVGQLSQKPTYCPHSDTQAHAAAGT